MRIAYSVLRFSPRNVFDGSRETYWYAGDRIVTPELALEFAVDAWQNGEWHEIASGTSVGSRRLLRVEAQSTHKVRLRITQAPVCPAIAEFSLFASSEAG